MGLATFVTELNINKMKTKTQFLAEKYENEDQFAAAVFMYVNHNYPSVRGLFYHIPNEYKGDEKKRPGSRFSPADMQRMKRAAIGVLPGVFDFHCVKPQFYLELKLTDNVTSKAQDEFAIAIGNVPNAVCWTPAEVCAFLEQLLGLPQFP